MKKRIIIYGLLFCICLIGLIFASKSKVPKVIDNNTGSVEKASYEPNKEYISYAEDDDIKNYNYVTNIEELKPYKLPYIAIDQFGDIVNEDFQAIGSYNHTVSIYEIERASSKINIKLIDSEENNIIITYDEKTGVYSSYTANDN